MHAISLRWRLMLSYALLAIMVVSSVGTMALWLIQRNLEQREIQSVQTDATAVAARAATLMRPSLNEWALKNLVVTAAVLGNARVRIVNPQGATMADSGPPDAQRMAWLDAEAEIPGTTGDDYVAFALVSNGSRVAMVPIGSRSQLDLLRAHVAQHQYQYPPSPTRIIPQTPITQTTYNNENHTLAIRVNQPIMSMENLALGSVEMISDYSQHGDTLQTAQRAFDVAALISVALAGLLGMLMARSVTSPLRALASVAARMGNGDLAARARLPQPHFGRDETSYLASQFNDMAARLDNSFRSLASERDALRHFVGDASHELRTPITALKTYNELLQTTAANDPAAQDEFLASSQQQIERLEWIIANLLDLSRVDAGLTPMNLAPHAVCEIITATARPFQVMAARKNVTLTLDLPPCSTPGAVNGQVFVNLDRPRLEMALSNLMDNALKHTPAGGAISIGGIAPREHKPYVEFFVKDSGPGIPPELQSRIFERFYRGPNSQGSGLGLAIVRGVAQAHGGSATVHSKLGEGSTFTISLPTPCANPG